MKVPKLNTANIETEEKYVRMFTFHLKVDEEENKRKLFDLNHKE